MSDDNPSYVVNVEAAIFNEGKYLIAERAVTEDHAAGMLGLVGGTVEGISENMNVLERTVRREIREEIGITIGKDEELHYLESGFFKADNGLHIVNVVFLCRHDERTAHVAEPEEIASVQWLTAEEIVTHPDIPPWTRRSIEHAEAERTMHGW
jgi:8-oxo-dGTP diphosphatase